MKNFLIDLCLVILLLVMINSLFNDYGIQKELFNQSLSNFETVIDQGEIVNSNYGSIIVEGENNLSLIVKLISDKCIDVIEMFVLLLSNLISTFF